MKTFAPEISPLQEKFALARSELAAGLIERDDEIDLVLTALIAQEHVLLVSPPGCGKSLLLDSILRWAPGRRFSLLLTKFTTSEEVAGPVSIRGLKEDRYRRVTTGRLPEAELAFLDEIFKGSSAILNTLLKMLNERIFENDGEAVPVPLRLCLCASNEWPQAQEGGKELNALFDRLLFRKSVRPILSQGGRQRLLWQRDHQPKLSETITSKELDQASEEAKEIPWTPEAKEALETILRELSKEGIQPGDRRQFKSILATQAYAWLQRASEVEPEHLEILQHVLWEAPEEQPEKVASVIARIANPAGMKLNQLLLEVEQVLSATDVRNLSQAATSTAKLAEIDKQLAGLKGKNGRLDKARAYVREQTKRIRLASLDTL
jgi:MoxR-like ATPase